LKPQQPRKPLKEQYDRLEFLREVESLHKRLNELIISPATDGLSDTKDDYAAGDVGSAANIAAALNVIAAALNANTSAVNQLLEKLNLST
jgi:hypothetical protein